MKRSCPSSGTTTTSSSSRARSGRSGSRSREGRGSLRSPPRLGTRRKRDRPGRDMSNAKTARSALIVLALLGGMPARAEESQGDNYSFAAASSQPIAVELARTPGGVRLAWPKASAWDTALLGVRVDAGAEEAPWVELSAGQARANQYFDPSAKGLRWINLSGLRAQLSEGTEVAITTHGVAVEAGNATLRVFAS